MPIETHRKAPEQSLGLYKNKEAQLTFAYFQELWGSFGDPVSVANLNEVRNNFYESVLLDTGSVDWGIRQLRRTLDQEQVTLPPEQKLQIYTVYGPQIKPVLSYLVYYQLEPGTLYPIHMPNFIQNQDRILYLYHVRRTKKGYLELHPLVNIIAQSIFSTLAQHYSQFVSPDDITNSLIEHGFSNTTATQYFDAVAQIRKALRTYNSATDSGLVLNTERLTQRLKLTTGRSAPAE